MSPRAAGSAGGPGGLPFAIVAGGLLLLLTAPLLALLVSATPADLVAGVGHPLFAPALITSARTSLVSLVLIVVLGTPLAWWLAHGPARWVPLARTLVDLPIVVPPAVLGIGLLRAFGRQGVLGPLLVSWGISLPFTASAVVLAQVVVAAPFYVQAASAAFARVDPELVVVARTLGQSPSGAFLRVTLPLALPGLVGGAAMAWARALGEFGATLLFAGNLPGRTQTMPLAIYTALEADVRVAVALSLVLAGVGLLLLLALRSATGSGPRSGAA